MSRGRYRNRPVLAGDISKVDFAEVEHAEHEAAVAREKVRLVKLRALLAAGWQTFQYRSPISEDYDREAYAPPGAKRVKVPEKSRSAVVVDRLCSVLGDVSCGAPNLWTYVVRAAA